MPGIGVQLQRNTHQHRSVDYGSVPKALLNSDPLFEGGNGGIEVSLGDKAAGLDGILHGGLDGGGRVLCLGPSFHYIDDLSGSGYQRRDEGQHLQDRKGHLFVRTMRRRGPRAPQEVFQALLDRGGEALAAESCAESSAASQSLRRRALENTSVVSGLHNRSFVHAVRVGPWCRVPGAGARAEQPCHASADREGERGPPYCRKSVDRRKRRRPAARGDVACRGPAQATGRRCRGRLSDPLAR